MKEALVRLIKELSAHLNLEELQNYHTSSGLETEEHFSKPFQKVAVDNISASTEREREREKRASEKRKKSREGVCLCTLQGALKIAVRLGDIRMVLCITVTAAVPGVR